MKVDENRLNLGISYIFNGTPAVSQVSNTLSHPFVDRDPARTRVKNFRKGKTKQSGPNFIGRLSIVVLHDFIKKPKRYKLNLAEYICFILYH